MDDIKQQALEAHKKLRGKIEVTLKDQLDKPEKLHTYYTPGVGAVSTYVAEHPEEAREYTWLNNNVAIISDGILYESGGQYKESLVRKVNPLTGQVIKNVALANEVFAEGLTVLNDKVYQIKQKSG